MDVWPAAACGAVLLHLVLCVLLVRAYIMSCGPIIFEKRLRGLVTVAGGPLLMCLL